MTDIGLACCALEFEAATPPARVSAAPGDRVAVVVSGTITDTLAPVVRATIDGIRATFDDVRVVSFGACTATGGPYWDSPTVTKGLDQLTPVDLMVPGCPPGPGALTDALDSLRREAVC